MVAVVSGSTLGLFNSSSAALGAGGTNGPASTGRGPDRLYVNSATGNLIIQATDERLDSAGLGLALVRTYNSQGLLDDDNWRLGIHQKLQGLTGAVNSAGSTITKVFGDGAAIVYRYDAARAAYVATDGDGAHDTLGYNISTSQWTWTDGSSRNTETYDAAGRLLAARDADGNVVTYAYTGSLLTQISDASGQQTFLDYLGNNLASIRVVSAGVTQTLTRYTYDAQNRLATVSVDLSPADNSVADGRIYLTTYTYDGASKRVASITQSDGTSVSFTYEESGGVYRVKTHTDALGRASTYTYASPSSTGGAPTTANVNAGVLSTTDSTVTNHVLNSGALTYPAGGWSAPVALESTAQPVTQILTGARNDGATVAAWLQGGALYASVYDPATQAWSAATQVSGRALNIAGPRLHVDPFGGRAILTWQDSATGSLYANRLDGASGAWYGAESLGTASGTLSEVSASINVWGSAAVLWRETSGANQTVRIRRYDGSSWLAAETVVSGTTGINSATVTIASDDVTQVLWRASDGVADRLYTRGHSTSSGWGATLQLDNGAAPVATYRTDTDPWADINVAWVQGNSVYMGWGGEGQDWTGPFLLGSTSAAITGLALSSSVSTTSAVAWITAAGEVYAYISATDTLELIATGASGTEVSIDVNTSTDTVVAWRSGNDLYERHYGSGAWSAPLQIESAGGAASGVSVVANENDDNLDDGALLAVWRQNDGVADSIYAARYLGGGGGGSPYYLVRSGDTWASIGQALYGSSAVASQLQSALGNPALTAGARLTGMPATIAVTTTVTVPAYYTIPAGATWTSVTQALYGTSDPNAVTALQAATGSPALATGLRLTVPSTLAYTAASGGPTLYLQTDLRDASGLTTSFASDSAGRLVGVLSPTTGGARLERRYAYDAEGNLTSIIEDPAGLNRVTAFQYDASGNVTLSRDALGNTVTRTYGAANELLTESRYVVPDPDGAGAGQPGGALTTRYAYDAENHLRFVVSATGRVTEHRYNAAGLRIVTLGYADARYSLAGLAAATPLTESQLATWAAARTLTLLERIDYAYDFRGNVSSVTAYAATDAAGNGLTAGASVTRFVYDQRGQLLSRIDPRGEATPADATDFLTTYTYDGLGRLLSQVEWIAAGVTRSTLTQYDDASNRTAITLANGLVATSTYNRAGELTSVINAGPGGVALGTTAYQYDASGRLRITTDATGQRQHILYDEAGRKIATVDADGTLTELVYDRASQVVKTIVYADRLAAATVATLIDGAGNPAAVALATLRTSLASVPGRNAAQDQISRAVYDRAGRLAYAVDEVGAVTQFIYDGASRLTDQVRYATPFVIARATDEVLPAAVAVSASANDRRTRHFYDDAGNRLATLDAAGYLVEFIYDAAGRLAQQIAYADATPVASRLSGTLAQLRPALDNETTLDSERDIVSYFFYDGQDRRVGALDGEGYLTETVYDEAGRTRQTVRYDYTLAYSANATLASLKAAVPAGATRRSTSFAYDGLGRLTQQTDHEGTVTGYGYDALNLTSTTAAQGTAEARTTRARYDLLGRVTAELTAEGSAQITSGMTSAQVDAVWDQYAVRYAYDLAGRRVSATDQNGLRTLFYYDADGRQTHLVNAEGEVTETQYDARGRLAGTRRYNAQISTSGLAGGLVDATFASRLAAAANNALDARTSTTYAYVATGRETTTSTAEGAAVTQRFNAFGDESARNEQIDAATQRQHTYAYDAMGRRTQTAWDPAGINRTETYQYDAFGRLTRTTDRYGNVRKTEHDRLGRAVAAVDPLNARRSTTYDAFDRVLTIVDALQLTTTYTYNDTTRSVAVTTPEGITLTTVHNRHGQTLSVTDGRGTLTSYAYDANGRLQSTTDPLGTLESHTYDRAGRELTAVDARGIVTTFGYDAVNRVLTRTVDSAAGGLALVTTYVYDDQGRVRDVTDPNGVLTRTEYDRDGRIAAVTVDPDGASRSRTTYTYDRTNNVLSLTEGAGGTNPRRTQYLYDALGRRIEEIVDAVALGGTLNLRTQYKYDANGNLTRKIDARGYSTWYIYDADSRLRYTVDAAGAVTERVYDLEDRLTATRRYARAVATAGFADVVTAVTVSADAAIDSFVQSVYDRDGRELYTIDAEGAVTERTFDALGNVTRTRAYSKAVAAGTYATAAAVTAALTAAGNSTSAIGADDRVTWTAYDARDRAVFQVDGSGAVVKFVRDGNGNVAAQTAYATLRSTSLAVDVASLEAWAAQAAVANHADNRVTRYWRDGADREVFKLDAEGYLTETRYGDAARLTSVILYRDKPVIAAGAGTAQVRQNSVVTGFNAARDQVTTTERDAAGRVIRVFDALSAAAASSYEEHGYDESGNRIWTIDPRGAELAERNSAWAQGERVRLGFSADAGALNATQKAALRARYKTTRTFDGAGRETASTDALGGITRKVYDALGNVVKLTDPRGNSGYSYYDANGRVRYQVDPGGYLTELRYDALGNATEEIGYASALSGQYSEATTLQDLASRITLDAARDRQHSSTYDRRGQVRTVTYRGAQNYTEDYQYNAFGDKARYQDRNNAVFEYRYNARGELTREILPAVEVVTAALPSIAAQSLQLENLYDYNAFGELSQKREAAGTTAERSTRYFQDRRGNVVRTELPALAVYDRATNATTTQTPVVQASYDAAGNLVLEIAANGGRTVNYYDSRNLRVASVDADNVLREYQYDAIGNLLAERTYDTRLSGVQAPASRPAPLSASAYRELQHQYNANSLRVRTQTRAETLFSYDLLVVTGQGYYDAAVVTLADYDSNGSLVRTVDGNGNSTYLYYDAKGNRVLQVDGAGYVTRWEYNAYGQVSRESKYAGRLSAAFRATLGAGTAPQAILDAVPAGDDRITEYEFDRFGRIVLERKLAVSYATVRESDGRLTPSVGNLETRYEYDGNGNLTGQVLPGAHGRIDFEYDALGRRIRQRDPQFQAFNGRGQPLASVRSETVLRYDAHGNVVAQTQLGQSSAEDREARFQYDSAGNLRTQSDPSGATLTQDYDISGNVVRSTRQLTDVAGTAHTYRTYHVYDVLGRETSRQDIEDEGTAAQAIRETQDTRYNAHGDIEAKGLNGQFQERYIYDRLGRVFWTNKENGTPRLYLYDANGNAVLEARAINSDLSQVNGTGGLRPIAGPADMRLLSPLEVQLTFSLYDARNQLTDMFQAPMEFGDLANTPTVTTSGAPGNPGEPALSDIAGYQATVHLGGQTRTVAPPTQSTLEAPAPTVVTGFGTPPAPSSSTQYLAIPTSEIAWSEAAGTTVNRDPVRDVTSADGLTRTVTERITRRTVAVDFINEPNQVVLRRVTTTVEIVQRVTTFQRSSAPTQSYGPGEQSLQSEWVTVKSEDLDGSSKSVDVKEDRYSRWRDTSVTSAAVGTAASYPGQLTLTPGVARILEHRTGPAVGPPWFSLIKVEVPAITSYGTGPVRVEVFGLNLHSGTLHYVDINPPGVAQIIHEGAARPTFQRIQISRAGNLIVDSSSVTQGSTITLPAAAGAAVVSVRAQHPNATSARLRLLDTNGNPVTNFVTQGIAGGEFTFRGVYDTGQRYEYEVFDGGGNLLNRVRGTIGGEHLNQYTATTTTTVTQRRTPVADGVNNFGYVETADSRLQNNYLRRLVLSITEGASNSRIIHRTQSYHAFGEFITQTHRRRNRTDFAYNDLGRLTLQQLPTTDVYPEQGSAIRLRPTTRFYYDELGQQVGTQDANSEQLAAEQKYFSTRVLVNGRVTKEFDTLGYFTQYRYDRLGERRQEINQVGLETSYAYDKNGRLTLATRYAADGSQHSYDRYEYDAAGNRIAHTDALGNRETYLFDGQNRVRRHTSFQGRQTQYDYAYSSSIGGVGGYEKTTTTAGLSGNDAAVDRTDYFGHIRYHRDIGGHEFTYLYNNAGWLKEQTGTTGGAQRSAQRITYDYYQNGLLRSISDFGVSSYARFQYDLDGNRTIEAYSQVPIAAGTPDLYPYQLATAEYDELNRVRRVRDPGKFDISYTYDAMSNRRSVESTYTDLLRNTTLQQSFYYKYDRMNRFTTTLGERIGGVIVRGNTGYDIEYDGLGRRLSVASDLRNAAGQAQAIRESYTYDPIDTVREVSIRNGSGTLLGRTLRENNAVGSVIDYREFNSAGTQTKHVHYDYDRDGMTTREEDRSDPNRREINVHAYSGKGILTSTTSTVVDGNGTLVEGTATVTQSYAYEKWDEYKQSTVTVQATAGNVRGWLPGTSSYRYDSNGHIQRLDDHYGLRTIAYVNDHNGHVLKRYETDNRPASIARPPVIRHFYYLNGIGIGDVGTDDVPSRVDYAQTLAARERDGARVHPQIGERVIPVTSADFDQNYQPINQNSPPRTAPSHVVQAGETLQSIARLAWGDATLWYLIAEANGLTGTEPLVAGTRLTLPNVVTNIHNTANTFRPYDVALALGDTNPTLPHPPPQQPQGKRGCGVLGIILVAVVAIVATVLTAGALAGPAGAGAGAAGAGAGGAAAGGATAGGAAAAAGGAAATTATAASGLSALWSAGVTALTSNIGAALIGGAVGSIVSQGVGIALGVQDGFSWSGVALGAIGAGVTAGLGQLSASAGAFGTAVRTFAETNPYTYLALHGAASNALTQGIAVATGLQTRFSWRDVAISSVAAPVAVAVGGAAAGAVTALGGSRAVADFASRVASGIGGSLVRRAFGVKVDTATALADAFGNAIGNSIIEGQINAAIDRRASELLEDVDLPVDRSQNRASFEFARELVQVEGLTQPQAAAILLQSDIRDGLRYADAARSGITDVEAEARALAAIETRNQPPRIEELADARQTELPDSQVVVVTGQRLRPSGPSGSSVVSNLFSAGLSYSAGLAELEADHPFLAQAAFTAGKLIFTGGPIKAVVTSIGRSALGNAADAAEEYVVGKVQNAVTSFITSWAEERDFSAEISIGGHSGTVDAALFGEASGQVAGGVVSVAVFSGGLSAITRRGRWVTNEANHYWKSKIDGVAQRTGKDSAHQVRTYREAIRLAKDPDVVRVHLDHGYNRALELPPGTISSNRRPDVIAVYRDGRVRRIEVQSRTDDPLILRQRNRDLDPQIRKQGYKPLPPEVVVPTRRKR